METTIKEVHTHCNGQGVYAISNLDNYIDEHEIGTALVTGEELDGFLSRQGIGSGGRERCRGLEVGDTIRVDSHGLPLLVSRLG